MYCSSCGVAIAQGLSFCNYCGAQLNERAGDIKSTEIKPGSLIASMVFLFVFGLVAITMLMGVMKAGLRFDSGPIIAFTLLSFFIMLVLEGVIIRLLFRRGRSAEESSNKALSKNQTTRELDARQAGLLPEPAPSVTEHTTRKFAPIYSEPAAK
jgi:hypothetical protein